MSVPLVLEEVTVPMDIEYLLALQQFRMGMGEGYENAMVAVTELCAGPALIFVALIVYWCIDKKVGTLATMSFALGNFVNQFIKNLFCVYRPWVLDARVHPAEYALERATGYSFPSGHTVIAGTILGGFAIGAWKKRKWLAAIFVLVVLLVGFTRNLLGVHTPQDVLVGLALAALMIAVCVWLVAWLEEHRDRDGLFVLGAFALGVIVLLVVSLKPYPMDYVNGALLVDPADMKKDCFEGVGLFWGFWLGWFCERRWVNFEVKGVPAKRRLLRVAFGAVLAVLVLVGLDPLLKAALGLDWAKLLSRFIVMFGGVFLVPWLERLIGRNGQMSGSASE